MNSAKDYEDEIQAFNAIGKKPSEIAAVLELDESEVYVTLRKLGLSVKSKNPVGLTDAQVKQVIEHYKNPTNKVSAICRTFGISLDALYEVLDRNNILLRTKTTEVQEAKKASLERAIMLYTSTDMPVYKIYIETGIAVSTIHLNLHKRGIPTRKELIELAEQKALEDRVNAYYSKKGQAED